MFPNATNLAEGSINFGINGSVGSSCANADAVDISAVNGINAMIEFDLTGTSWPFTHGENGPFGRNADQPGVYGWAATTCVNNTGHPNPSKNCPPPRNAPRAPIVNGICTTPQGTHYSPMLYKTGVLYCDERSDATQANPQGQCVSQRPGGVTGGTVAITFNKFYNPPAPPK